MDLQLAGKVALVTGASMGLGRSIAALLAEEGCRMAIVARRVSLLEKVANEIASTGKESPLIIVEDIRPMVPPNASRRRRWRASGAWTSW